MLLHVLPNNGGLKNMHVSSYTKMCLFTTSFEHPTAEKPEGKITVTFNTPIDSEDVKIEESIEIPLLPSIEGLCEISIDMHLSPTTGYDMGERFNAWFSKHFGYEVILAYIGANRRPVLGNLSPNHAGQVSKGKGWLSTITSSIPYLNTASAEDNGITFADCAPYLVVTTSSLADASSRLPPDETMDVTKFRPNIVLSGASEAWEEDFWAELQISGQTKIVLTANCARCTSLNVDYATGKPGKSEAGKILKLLMKDRRVDAGTKYSPIFGRYGFLENGKDGVSVKVGDEVEVTRVNGERTTFEWPGL